jgi:hypothetical protein
MGHQHKLYLASMDGFDEPGVLAPRISEDIPRSDPCQRIYNELRIASHLLFLSLDDGDADERRKTQKIPIRILPQKTGIKNPASEWSCS